MPDEWKGLLSEPDSPHDEPFGDIEVRVKDFQTQQKMLQSFQEAKDKEVSSKAHKPKMSVKLTKPSSHYYDRCRYCGHLWRPLPNLETPIVLKRLPTTKDSHWEVRLSTKKGQLSLLNQLHLVAINGFIGGQLSLYLTYWKHLTNDPYILAIIDSEVTVLMIDDPSHRLLTNPTTFSVAQQLAVELKSLLRKRVVMPTQVCPSSIPDINNGEKGWYSSASPKREKLKCTCAVYAF